MPSVDLEASITNGLGGWRLGMRLRPGEEQVIAWPLTPSTDIGGRLLALDGKTPLGYVVVELVSPRGSSSEGAVKRSPSTVRRTNPVLSLPDSGSFVELPAEMFGHLEEGTIEAWANWQSFQNTSHIFEFGNTNHGMVVSNRGTTGELIFSIRHIGGRLEIMKAGQVQENQWHHIAAIAGPSGLKLYLDGLLVCEGASPGRFSEVAGTGRNLLGACVFRPNGADDFHGYLAEVRVWKTIRTPEQIRENMFKSLQGNEAGLFTLWNFADNAQDATTNAFHGTLRGHATVIDSFLPTRRVYGKITDPTGSPAARATIEVRQRDQPLRRFTANGAGEYAVTLDTPGPCDMFVHSGEFFANRLDFQTGSESERLNWLVKEMRTEARLAPDDSLNRFVDPDVVATAMTDELGAFKFRNILPGRYQVRVQIPGGREWFDAGRVLYAEAELTPEGRAKLAALELRVAPFKKGRWTKFSVIDGLPTDRLGGMLCTPDNAIWVNQSQGLVRFDGREFVKLTGEYGGQFPGGAPLSRFADRDGVFWLGTLMGLFLYNPVTANPPVRFIPAKTPTEGIQEITGGVDGAIWWRTQHALIRWQGGQCVLFTNLWREIRTDGPYSFLRAFPQRLAAAGDRLWVVGPGAGLVLIKGTNQIRFGREHGLLSDDTGTVATAPDGAVWLTVGSDQVARFDGTNFSYLTAREGLPKGDVTHIHATRKGEIWFGMFGKTAGRFDGRSFTHFSGGNDGAGRQSNYGGSACWDILDGPDGALWFSTGNGGLWRYEENAFQDFTSADGLAAEEPGTMQTAADASLSVGSGKNNFTLSAAGRFKAAPESIMRPGMVSGPDGLTWAILDAKPGAVAGISRLRGGELISVITNLGGLSASKLSCLARGTNGAIWVGASAGGVIRFEGNEAAQTLTATNGLLASAVSDIHCDRKGRIWIATFGGIVLFDGHVRKEFPHPFGDVSRFANQIESGPNDSVWFSSLDAGMVRFNNQTGTLSVVDEKFAPASVIKMFRAQDGDLWFGTLSGVTHYDGVAWASLDERDGLLPGRIVAIAQDVKGDFWFGGEKGLTRYQPMVSTNPPPLVVVQTDQLYTNLNRLPDITSGRLVTFKCNSVDFRTRPDKRFYRYAIVPGLATSAPSRADVAWESPTREAQFSWPARSRGEYTFFAQSIDRDLNYSESASVVLRIVPPWFANGFIMAPSGGALLGLVGWAFIARSMVIRRKREADVLREQLLAQEQHARRTLESTNKDLAEARNMADDANKTKSQFLANMSHELRTPLNAILGYTEMVKEELADLKANHLVADLDKVTSAAKHQLGLVNDILDLSKVESGKMTLFVEEFDVARLVDEVAATMKPMIEKNGNGIVVQKEGLGVIHADQTKLRQILLNLLSNASKFTNNGTITLRAQLETSSLKFEIADSGIGMTPEQLSRLFQAFSQADAGTAQKYGGTGLGLALSRRFAELMGGSLTVRSEAGKGSTFTVDLPTAAAPAPDSAA